MPCHTNSPPLLAAVAAVAAAAAARIRSLSNFRLKGARSFVTRDVELEASKLKNPTERKC